MKKKSKKELERELEHIKIVAESLGLEAYIINGKIIIDSFPVGSFQTDKKKRKNKLKK